MEPTMAPTMMLVVVIPETEEERRLGSRNVCYLNVCLLFPESCGHNGIHKPQDTAAEHINTVHLAGKV